MKNFLLFLIIFFIMATGIDFIATTAFDNLYAKTRTGQTGGEINKYLILPRSYPLLIMGNSRARYQINPDSFALHAYSLCHAGMGQVFQTGLLEILEQQKKLPQAILLHVDFAEYTAPDNLEDIGNLRYYYGKIPAVTTTINNISRYEIVKYQFRFYRYNGRVISTLKNYLQSRHAFDTGNGYQSLLPIANDSTTFGTHERPGNITPFYTHSLQHLEDFINICQRHHIQLLCFTSPYYASRSYAPIAAMHIDSMLTQHHIPYFDASKNPLPILTHHARFWQDNDHLNSLGAEYLSQQIAHWANPYLHTVQRQQRAEQ